MSKRTEELMKIYSDNEMAKLRSIVNGLATKSGWGSDGNGERTEVTDFYSVANIVLWKSAESWDEKSGTSFDLYLRSNLNKKWKSYLRDMNVEKRIPVNNTTSFDVETDDKHQLAEVLPADETVESQVFPKEKAIDKADLYMSKLSKMERKIIQYRLEGYSKQEIMKKLNINVKIYDLHWDRIKREAKILY